MGSDLKLGVNDFAGIFNSITFFLINKIFFKDMSKEEFEVLAAGTVVDQAEHDAA